MTVGKIVSWLIMLMNRYIEGIESLPGSLWDGMQINLFQAILLFIAIGGAGHWLLGKWKAGLFIGLMALLGFFAARSSSFMAADRQQKLIVYNVPQRRAIDFIRGRDYYFYGDSILITDDFTRNFHLKPSRVLNRDIGGDNRSGAFYCTVNSSTSKKKGFYCLTLHFRFRPNNINTILISLLFQKIQNYILPISQDHSI